jgi:hypothetical protein
MIAFSNDPSIRRMRWAMAAIIAFDAVITLAGQWPEFWIQPSRAHVGNQLMLWALLQGVPIYLAWFGAYLFAAVLIVSMLPRTLAVTVVLSVTFVHYFGGNAWLSYHFHFPLAGWIWPALVAALLTTSGLDTRATSHTGRPQILGFSSPRFTTDIAIQRLRWLAAAVALSDAVITLLGQAPIYWQDHTHVNEGDPIVHWVLARSVSLYVLCGVVYITGLVIVASILPRRIAIGWMLWFILLHFFGTSTWLAFHYHLRVQASVGFGIVIAVVAVALGLDAKRAPTSSLAASPSVSEPNEQPC